MADGRPMKRFRFAPAAGSTSFGAGATSIPGAFLGASSSASPRSLPSLPRSIIEYIQKLNPYFPPVSHSFEPTRKESLAKVCQYPPRQRHPIKGEETKGGDRSNDLICDSHPLLNPIDTGLGKCCLPFRLVTSKDYYQLLDLLNFAMENTMENVGMHLKNSTMSYYVRPNMDVTGEDLKTLIWEDRAPSDILHLMGADRLPSRITSIVIGDRNMPLAIYQRLGDTNVMESAYPNNLPLAVRAWDLASDNEASDFTHFDTLEPQHVTEPNKNFIVKTAIKYGRRNYANDYEKEYLESAAGHHL